MTFLLLRFTPPRGRETSWTPSTQWWATVSRGLVRSIHLGGKKSASSRYQEPTTTSPNGELLLAAASAYLAMHEKTSLFFSSSTHRVVIIIGNIWQRFNTQLEVMFHDLSSLFGEQQSWWSAWLWMDSAALFHRRVQSLRGTKAVGRTCCFQLRPKCLSFSNVMI